jgi:hypothetical protein
VDTRERHGRRQLRPFGGDASWAVIPCALHVALRHTPAGKRRASCGGCARAYGQGVYQRPGRSWRPAVVAVPVAPGALVDRRSGVQRRRAPDVHSTCARPRGALVGPVGESLVSTRAKLQFL